MKKWVNKITQISLSNIQEQTFIIELLSLAITDHLEKPIPDYQNYCRRLLFTIPKYVKDEDINDLKTNNNKNADGEDGQKYTGFLRKSHLISFELDKEDNP